MFLACCEISGKDKGICIRSNDSISVLKDFPDTVSAFSCVVDSL